MPDQEGQTGKVDEKQQEQMRTLHTRNEIRRLLRLKLRPYEIMERMNMPRSTYYKHYHQIQKEDRKWLKELAKDEFVHAYKLSLEVMDDMERNLMVLAEETKDDELKAHCYESVAQLEVYSLNMLAFGPTVLAVGGKKSSEGNLAIPKFG
jgi:hypothetical protein